MFKVSYQNEDVLQAKRMEFLHHLWKVSESPGVEGEDSTLVRIVQIVPLYILTKQIKTYFVCLGCTDMTKRLLQYFTFLDPQQWNYHWEFCTVHPLCNLPGCFWGGVTPATQMKTQWPVGRHQRIPCRYIKYHSNTFLKRKKKMHQNELERVPITCRYWRITHSGSGPRKI